MTPSVATKDPIAVVTGASGFIGKYVTAVLARAGFQVRALLWPPTQRTERRGRPRPSEIEADICDLNALLMFTQGADLLVHLAGPPSVADSFDEAGEYVRVHVQGTACVLDACRHSGVRKIIYLSSAEVYGRPGTHLVSEEHPLGARSPYAAAKIGAEAMISAYAASRGQDAVILRPFSIYGPGASRKSLLIQIIERVRSGQPVVVRDLRPVRDYCFVEDVANAVLLACMFRADPGLRIFNVGTMRGSSVSEVGNLLIGALGSKVPLLEEDQMPRPGASEIYRLVSDSSLAHSVLGWTPQVSLELGIRLTAEAYK